MVVGLFAFVGFMEPTLASDLWKETKASRVQTLWAAFM